MGVLVALIGVAVLLAAALLPLNFTLSSLIMVFAVAVIAVGVTFDHRQLAGHIDRLTQENVRVEQTVAQMDSLLRASSQVALARPLGDILEEICSLGGRILGNDRCAIFEAGEDLLSLFHRDVSVGFYHSMKEAYRLRKGLFATARSDLVPVEDCQRDKRLAGARAVIEGEGIRSLLFVPLVYEKLILGFMFLFYEKQRSFSVEDLSLAAAFGSQAAIAIRGGQLRQELDSATRELRNLLDNASDLVWTMSPDGKCTTINRRAEELTGRKTAQWIGKTFVDFVVPDDRGLFIDKITSSFAGRPQRFELRLDNEGKPVYLSAHTTALYREGEVSSLVVFARDLTEERKLNEQLMQAQRMESLGTLAGGIAHDFNNVLSSILGHATLLRNKLDPAEGTLHHHVELIEKSARRAGHLTSQLLGFARKGRYRVEPIDLNTILLETYSLIERGIEKTIEIKLDLAENLPAVMGDAAQIEQAFMNVVLNARDAMEGTGTIFIKTLTAVLDEQKAHAIGMRAGPCVVVGFRDTGPGVKPEDQARIFEPFYTTKEVGKGTGLGLSMVIGIMRNHGGAVQLASVPGHGATFSLYFVPAPIAIPSPVQAPVLVPSATTGNETILVVDDEDTVLEVSRETLVNAGYKVLTASDGADGVEVFRKNVSEIDLVILDLVMPRMGGRVAFFKMRELKPLIPVLIVSGYGVEEDVQAVLAAGVDGFLQKPFILSELLEKVREILNTRKATPVENESSEPDPSPAD